MFMLYIYLSLIPTLLAILMLFFNKSFKNKYNIKKAIPILSILLIVESISITREYWFSYNSSPKYLIALSIIYIVAPIFVLCTNKAYKYLQKESVKENKQ